MLLVTEKDEALSIIDSMPPSLIKTIYLTEGQIPQLDLRPTVFGKPIHLVYLGHNLRSVENFVSSVTTNTESIILISPLSRWGLYNVKLKHLPNLVVSDQLDSVKSKVSLVSEMTGLNKSDSREALNCLNFNFGLIEAHIDLLQWCAKTKSDVTLTLASVETYSYSDILFYLCGSTHHTREKFIKTLAKYRNGKKSIMKFLKKTLDGYIKVHLEGEEPPKDSAYLITKLSKFLYLDDALRLRYTLDNVKDLTDLLKGEV